MRPAHYNGLSGRASESIVDKAAAHLRCRRRRFVCEPIDRSGLVAVRSDGELVVVVVRANGAQIGCEQASEAFYSGRKFNSAPRNTMRSPQSGDQIQWQQQVPRGAGVGICFSPDTLRCAIQRAKHK